MGTRGEELQAQVLAVLRQSESPLSAYDVLGELRKTNPKIAPPTVYRALAALTGRRIVHRLESLSAYMACKRENHENASILSICDDCGIVEESVAPEVLEDLSTVAGQSGFRPARHVIEIHGMCASCVGAERPA